MKELAELIADLARAVAKFEGGSQDGVTYTSFTWREKLERIAKRADELVKGAKWNTRTPPEPSAEPVEWSPGREYAKRYNIAVTDEWVRGFDACHFAREVEDLSDEMEASRHD